MSARRLVELERSRRRRAVLAAAARVVMVWTVIVAAYYLAPSDRPASGTGIAALLAGGALFVATMVWQVRRILTADLPELRAIEALGALFPLFIVLFASAYAALSLADAGNFTQPLDRPGAMYFTVTVLTTVGFGDIAPVTTLARHLVTAQMILDVILLAALARLVLTAARFSLKKADTESAGR